MGAIPRIELEKVASGFKAPVYVADARDGSQRLFVVEQAGVVRTFHPQAGTQNKSFPIFLDIRDRVDWGGEKGLLGLAFHPDFRHNRRFFVNYVTTRDGGGKLGTRISEFLANPDLQSADAASEKILIKFLQPFPNHKGGMIVFGPDNNLYIGTGDGGSANDPFNAGQRLNTLLGKILRIDVNKTDTQHFYSIPSDNPFLKEKEAKPEIFAYGLRNPWRFSFDRQTGALFVGDVGQDAQEEIDVVEKGKNYGWRIMEGTDCTPGVNRFCDKRGLELPITTYGRDEGGCVIGGYVYRGAKYPSLQGIYFFADFNVNKVFGLRYDSRRQRLIEGHKLILKTPFPVSSFGEDEAGEIYLISYLGDIYRLKAAPLLQPH